MVYEKFKKKLLDKENQKQFIAQETSRNHTTVVSDAPNPLKKSFALIQNYRRYFNFSKKTFKAPNRGSTDPPSMGHGQFNFTGFVYKAINHGHEHFFGNFNGCNVLVKKKIVEITNKQFEGQWVEIATSEEYLIDVQLNQIRKDLDSHCVETLKLFVQVYGGESDFECLKNKREPEIGLPREDVWDKIPKEMIVHFDPVGKKVYPDKVEYFGENYVANVLSNTGLHRYSKVIGDVLNHNTLKIETLISQMKANGDILKWAEDNLTSVQDVMKHEEVLGFVPRDKRLELSLWLFEKFGGETYDY